MKCLIIEDQPPAQRILKKYITDFGGLELQATYSNAVEALEFLMNNKTDLIFLDIHLPKISGIDFLKTITDPPAIILTTAFPDFALESYEFDVVDYLLKPFSFQRFLKAVAKIPNKNTGQSITEEPEISIFIKSGNEHIKISIQDINYIKSDRDYTEIHLHRKKHLSSESLKYWSEYLPHEVYVRVHKSFIVNVKKVIKHSRNQIHMEEGTIIPVGRKYKDAISKIIS